MDPRNSELAKVFINHSLKVQKGDNVVISTSDLEPLDLIRETYKEALQKGANVYLDILGCNFLLDRSSVGDLVKTLYDYGSEEQLAAPSTIYKNIFEWGDKFVRITSFDNYQSLKNVDTSKIKIREKSRHDWFHTMINNKDWVLTYYPTSGMAQQAGMSTQELFDFYFESVLVDYEAMEADGLKIRGVLDKAKEIRLVGERTDLLINVEDRLFSNSSGTHNVPDGEVFAAPQHLRTEGHIYYDVPFSRPKGEIHGAYLEFEQGKVVKATAEAGEDFLLETLDSDEGARYLGELGIGLNYGIDTPMKSTLFDEKMGGTVHVTLGRAYEYDRGGAPEGERNESVIHWDLVKDMRKPGSKIYVDGELKFEDGQWRI